MYISMCDLSHKMKLGLSESEVMQAVERYVFLH